MALVVLLIALPPLLVSLALGAAAVTIALPIGLARELWVARPPRPQH